MLNFQITSARFAVAHHAGDAVRVGVVARFQGGDTSLANRVLSLIALHVWWEDYLGEHRVY